MNLRACTIAFLILFATIQARAFDVPVNAVQGELKDAKFNFSIAEVIDARPAPSRPMGMLWDAVNKAKLSVGNAELGAELSAFFTKDQQHFVSDQKLLLVIKQLTIQEVRNRKRICYKITLGVDYFKVAGEKCVLVFQQFLNVPHDATPDTRQQDISIGFTRALIEALRQAERQLANFRTKADVLYAVNALRDSLLKPVMEASPVTWKDGVYFNTRELLLNEPGYFNRFTLLDSAKLKNDTLALSSSAFLLQDAYAIVSKGKLYVNVGRNAYVAAERGDGSRLNLYVEADRLYTGESGSSRFAGDVSEGLIIATVGLVQYETMVNKGKSSRRKRVEADLFTGAWLNMIYGN